MNRLYRWLAAGVALFALVLPAALTADETSPPAAPPTWPVSTAPARFTIVPNRPDQHAVLSWIKLGLPDPAWESMPLRVFTEAGVPVGSDLLWTAPGEPVTLLFDSSSDAKKYQVYVGSNWPPLYVPDAHAGVWVESRPGDGQIVKTLPDMLAAWNKSSPSNGRAIAEAIFEGGHRFGPQGNLLLHLQGWFSADKPEHLDFAVVSVDSSFVLVDGKEVVEWPGNHDWGYGPQGPPQGGVDVGPGVHVVDYYNAYLRRDGGRPPVMCCLSVKGGPYADWTMLTPDRPFFRPAGQARAVAYELQAASSSAASGKVPPLAFQWRFETQSPISTDEADLGLVSLRLECLTPPPGTLTWKFDDGTSAQGANIVHVFPRPGPRVVELNLKDGDKVLASVTRTISVHLSWSPIVHMDPYLEPAQEADVMARDPATLSAPDLASAFSVLGAFQKSDDLLKMAPALSAKMKEVGDADLPSVYDAIKNLIRGDRAHFLEEETLLRAMIDRTAGAKTGPLVVIAGEARLFLAQLLVKNSDELDEVHKLIDAIGPGSLPDWERRALEILRGDVMLAAGDVDGARKKYTQLTGDPQGVDARSSIRRTAKISQARTFTERRDFDAAEDALREVSWVAPVEKLAPDWALSRLKLFEAEKLPDAAYWWARRLLPVLHDAGRSELLYQVTDLAFARKDDDLAHRSLDELLKKHPYSEEAARAKERWP